MTPNPLRQPTVNLPVRTNEHELATGACIPVHEPRMLPYELNNETACKMAKLRRSHETQGAATRENHAFAAGSPTSLATLSRIGWFTHQFVHLAAPPAVPLAVPL